MSSTLSALTEYLFTELDALTNGDLTAEQLDLEIKRAQAVSNIGIQIINTAQTQLKVVALRAEYEGARGIKMPALIAGDMDEGI